MTFDPCLSTRGRRARHFISNLRSMAWDGVCWRWWRGQEDDDAAPTPTPEHLLDLPVTCAGGRTVWASRLILAAAAPKLAEMLKDRWLCTFERSHD